MPVDDRRAKPVLADSVSLDNWNLSPADVQRKITKRTKAVMVLHYGGYPCEIEEITGAIVRQAASLGEPVPIQTSILTLIRAAEHRLS